MTKDLIIAVDGYSGCGKSTLAKNLARKLNYTYIDSGAMYRAVTLFAIRNQYFNEKILDVSKLKKNIKNIDISFKINNKNDTQEIFLNGTSVESEIRKMDVADLVSSVSKIDFVREKLVSIQRKMGLSRKIVMDGRDIGTVVFPDADLKIFMTAEMKIRAQRRYDELRSQNPEIKIDEIMKNLSARDYIDVNRDISPLKKASDAIIIDNSNMTKSEQLDFVIDLINQKFAL